MNSILSMCCVLNVVVFGQKVIALKVSNSSKMHRDAVFSRSSIVKHYAFCSSGTDKNGSSLGILGS